MLNVLCKDCCAVPMVMMYWAVTSHFIHASDLGPAEKGMYAKGSRSLEFSRVNLRGLYSCGMRSGG